MKPVQVQYAVTYQDGLYFLSGGRDPQVVRCLRGPHGKMERFQTNVSDDRFFFYDLVFHDKKIHIVGRDWWVADDLKSEFVRLNGTVPGNYARKFCQSDHYGLLLLYSGVGPCRVEFER